jgi:hypothetical protein
MGLTIYDILNESQDQNSGAVKNLNLEDLITQGKLTGYSVINKFGRNPDCDTATVPEDVWGGGGTYTGFPLGAAELVQVFSSSANDTAVGSGARTVQIIGLNSSYVVQSETITLNGVTPVTTANTYIRVHTANVRSSGSSNTAFNAGTITVRHVTTTANVFLVIPIGTNQSAETAYTVPAGKTAYLRNVFSNVLSSSLSGNVGVDLVIYIREFGLSPRLRRPYGLNSSSASLQLIYGGLRLPEKTDACIRIQASSANNVDVSVAYDLVLVDN